MDTRTSRAARNRRGALAEEVTIANIGVHGVSVALPMREMWIRNVTVTMGLVDTVSIPTLLKMVAKTDERS